jgi:hypothetical protein
MKKGEKEEKLTPGEFFIQAIKNLRQPPHLGIHMVWSGFNLAFREYFPDLDPVKTAKELARQGKIVLQVMKGGARIYLPNEVPEKLKQRRTSTLTKRERKEAKKVLRKMGLG